MLRYEGKKTRMSGGYAYHRWLCWDFEAMLELAWDLQKERRLLSSSTIKHKDIAFRIGSNILWMSNFSCTSSHLHKVAPPSMWSVLRSSIFLCVQVLYALFMFGFPLREPCVIFAWLTMFLSFNLHVFAVVCGVTSLEWFFVKCFTELFHVITSVANCQRSLHFQTIFGSKHEIFLLTSEYEKIRFVHVCIYHVCEHQHQCETGLRAWSNACVCEFVC